MSFWGLFKLKELIWKISKNIWKRAKMESQWRIRKINHQKNESEKIPLKNKNQKIRTFMFLTKLEQYIETEISKERSKCFRRKKNKKWRKMQLWINWLNGKKEWKTMKSKKRQNVIKKLIFGMILSGVGHSLHKKTLFDVPIKVMLTDSILSQDSDGMESSEEMVSRIGYYRNRISEKWKKVKNNVNIWKIYEFLIFLMVNTIISFVILK